MHNKKFFVSGSLSLQVANLFFFPHRGLEKPSKDWAEVLLAPHLSPWEWVYRGRARGVAELLPQAEEAESPRG